LGDTGRVRQIVLNLLDNAFKFTESGSVALRIESSEQVDGLWPFKFR
jgi:signal transduction histidine kinase